MPDLLIARDPIPGGRLPYLLSLPVAGEAALILACAEVWPGAKDVFCHPLSSWPPDAQLLETLPVEQCWRVGKAVHLVLQRRQRRRSLFVWTVKGERQLIFWRSQRSMGAARPGMKVPAARGLDGPLEIAVDVRERYGWRFGGLQATLVKRELPVGDYGIFLDGRLVAAVERKTPADLAGSAIAGTVAFALAELEALPHACLVVEGRFSDLLKATKDQVQPDWLLSVMAALQLRHPRVAWTFAETRDLAQAYAYRWLAAARQVALEVGAGTAGGKVPAGAQDRGAAPKHWTATDESTAAGSTAAEARTRPRHESGPVQLPLRVRDRRGRLAEALALATGGRDWTSPTYAAHFSISQATAWQDLTALVEAGALKAEGERRGRRYRRVGEGESGGDSGG
ncbi:MAG: ERCC4 domain-containing protein [Anaerolineae bacterium]